MGTNSSTNHLGDKKKKKKENSIVFLSVFVISKRGITCKSYLSYIVRGSSSQSGILGDTKKVGKFLDCCSFYQDACRVWHCHCQMEFCWQVLQIPLSGKLAERLMLDGLVSY